MKKYLICISILLSATIQGALAQTQWNINGGHSNINFAVQWREFAYRTGEFKVFGGKIYAPGEADMNNATVQLAIQVDSVDLIAPNLSKMVQSEEYLDSARCPIISFECQGMKRKRKNKYVASGILTIRCKEVPTTFDVELLGLKDTYAALKVSATLDKSAFGIVGGGERLGNTILISSYFELNKKKLD